MASYGKGLKQRLKALNLFLDDVYNDQLVIRDGIVPEELVTASPHFIELACGVRPPFDTWAHICGSDLVRDHTGKCLSLKTTFEYLAGFYMLENRSVMKQVYPELFRNHQILPVSQYASDLLDMLNALSPRPVDHPVIVVLTPGIYNSAYFEHSYLAQQVGAELVQGSDLFVDTDDCVYMKAVEGVSRVDVIYRRIDDTFLDPESLNPDSVLGVPGLMRAWRAGKVAIANAPGAVLRTTRCSTRTYLKSSGTTWVKNLCYKTYRLISAQILNSGPMSWIIWMNWS